MAAAFDPYFKWLGIRPEHQPPDHYRLLGLQRFESDVEVIENATDAKMAYLRPHRLGQRMAIAKAVVPVAQISADQVSDADDDDRVELPKRHGTKHHTKRQPLFATLAISAVVASAAVLAVVLMLLAFRGNSPEVARRDKPSTTVVRPTLPPVEPIASATSDVQQSRRKPGNENNVPQTTADPSAAQTTPPVDDQQQTAPAAVEPQPPEALPPAEVVVASGTKDVQPEPAEAAATDPQPGEPTEPTASVDSEDPVIAPADSQPLPVQRKAIPEAADQAAIEANIREVYQAAQIGTSTQRKELTEKLLDDALATGDAPNEQFVMLRLAAEMAAATGDLERAEFAVGLIDERFQIDAVAMRLDLIEQAAKAPSSPEEKQEALSAALPLLDAALRANRFADGDKHLRIFEETRLRCLSIWGSNPSRAYFVLKLR